MSEGRAQAPLLAQDLLVGHGVDGVGEGEGRAAEKGRQGGGEEWGQDSARLTLPGQTGPCPGIGMGALPTAPSPWLYPAQAPVAPRRPSQAPTSVRSSQDAAFAPGPSLLCRLGCARVTGAPRLFEPRSNAPSSRKCVPSPPVPTVLCLPSSTVPPAYGPPFPEQDTEGETVPSEAKSQKMPWLPPCSLGPLPLGAGGGGASHHVVRTRKQQVEGRPWRN